MDGTWADDDEDTVVAPRQYPGGRKAGGGNGVEGALGSNDLMSEERWLDEGVVLDSGWDGKKTDRGGGDKM